MVILVFNTRAKLMIPRHKTLLWHAQNTHDHALALHWTQYMPRASQQFLRGRHRALCTRGEAVSLITCAQRRNAACSCARMQPIARSSSRASRRYAAVARSYELEEHGAARILWQQTRHPSRSTWAETCQVGAEAHGLFDGAPRTPSRFGRRTRPSPSWKLRFKAATRERDTFGVR